MNTDLNLTVSEQDAGKRLDVFITEKSDLTRSQVQRLIKDEQVKLNNNPVKANLKIANDDIISVIVPAPIDMTSKPENLDIEIVYEDADIAVINKPQGMVVHPAAGNFEGTLVNALLYHLKDLSGIGGVVRPGIVHRIDKDTSGLLVVAKNDVAHVSLAEQIKNHTVKRVYQAVVHGLINVPEGMVDAPIGRHANDRKKMAVTSKNSKHAVTHFKVLARYKGFTHIEARLETGRTHQIRVHMNYAGHPVVGDPIYGPRKNHFAFLKGQVLHAAVLGFNHPTTGEYMEFNAPLPEYFLRLLNEIKD